MANLNLLHRFSPLQDETVQLNMDDLRGRLAQRLALLAIAVAQFFILFYESAEPFPLPAIGFWLLLTAVAVGALSLSNQKPRLARHLLVWGLTAVLLFAMIFLPAPWLPFVGVLLIFCQAMLVQGSEFVTGTMMVGTAVYLSLAQNYPYPLAGVLTNLILAVLIAWLTIRALYTALDWLSKTQRRAEQLLDVTRSQQAELRSTVKSLQITNEARLQAERELLIANKQARESQRMKEQFAANISHEFRTPLSIILGFSEVMYLSPEVYGGQAMPPKLYRDVSQIYRNSRHLMSMIDDILDLSHFEMTGFTLNKEPTNLEPLMQESLSMVADLFRNDAVTLVADIEPELPLLELDRTRMRQVFLNLLNNACRFTEQGTVTLRAFRQEGELHIQVADTGPGIPEEQLARIFTEFYQVDYSLSRKHGGAGLGLAICHRFVQAHNGRIWVNSILGEGATFTIALPIEELSPGGRLYRTRSLEAQPSDKLPPVFMIDSDPTVVSLVQRHLTEFDIVPLPDAADLAEQVAEQLPAAVVWNVAPGSVPPAPTLALPVPVISWHDTLAENLQLIFVQTETIMLLQIRYRLVVCRRAGHQIHRDGNAITFGDSTQSFDQNLKQSALRDRPQRKHTLGMIEAQTSSLATRDQDQSQLPFAQRLFPACDGLHGRELVVGRIESDGSWRLCFRCQCRPVRSGIFALY